MRRLPLSGDSVRSSLVLVLHLREDSEEEYRWVTTIRLVDS